MAKREVTELEIREIAVEAGADPRSVRKRLRGEGVRGLVGERIDRAIAGVQRGDSGVAVRRGS